MSRQWERGDVAVITFARGDVRAMYTGDGWVLSDMAHLGTMRGFEVNRPLVVIDPEDRAAVEAFRDLYDSEIQRQNPDLRAISRGARGNALQAALRSLITPPKPEEPTGLGAVVETANGKRYVRWAEGFFDGRAWAPEDGAANALRWEHIAAVKVLSEGVTP